MFSFVVCTFQVHAQFSKFIINDRASSYPHHIKIYEKTEIQPTSTFFVWIVDGLANLLSILADFWLKDTVKTRRIWVGSPEAQILWQSRGCSSILVKKIRHRWQSLVFMLVLANLIDPILWKCSCGPWDHIRFPGTKTDVLGEALPTAWSVLFALFKFMHSSVISCTAQ